MKLKLFFIVLLALLASGCAQEVLAVPEAVLKGTGNVITAVVDTLIFWD
jgi:PBP1b-binding outer membrane lipoprotein LpoB